MELEVPSAAVRTESDASLSRTDTASDNEELHHSGVVLIFFSFPSMILLEKTVSIPHKLIIRILNKKHLCQQLNS